MDSRSIMRRMQVAAVFVLAVLLVAGTQRVSAEQKRGTLRFTTRPHIVTPGPVSVGENVTFEVATSFPGESWTGYRWQFLHIDSKLVTGHDSVWLGDDEPIDYGGPNGRNVHVEKFSRPGRWKALAVAFHGVKDGPGPGIGATKPRFSIQAKFTFEVLPRLPIRVGTVRIDGDTITRLGDDSHWKVSGNVTINQVIQINNPVLLDLEKGTVTFRGALSMPQAGRFQSILSTAKDVTIDTKTGELVGLSLNEFTAGFEIGGFAVEFTNIRIENSGVEFDFKMEVPRMVKVPTACNPEPDPDDGPGGLVKLDFKRFRVDGVPPYLHALGPTSASLGGLNIPGTGWGLDDLTLGFETEPREKYFGSISICLPSERGLAGEIEILDGGLDKIGFTLNSKFPLYTFTGLGDALFVTSINAKMRNLQGFERPMLSAGEFDPVTGAVTTPGVVMEWRAGLPVAGLDVAPVTLEGAAEWDDHWNVTVGGDLILFKDLFGDDFRVAQMRGSYRFRPNGGIFKATGVLQLRTLASVGATFTTSFNPSDAFVTAYGRGQVLVSPTHWARRFMTVPTITADVIVMFRATPREKYLAAVRGVGQVPVFGNIQIVLQYDLITGEFSTKLDSTLVGFIGPGKGQTRTATLRGGQGAGGLIVELTFAQGTPAPVLRLPDGTLLTPADVDGVSTAYSIDTDVGNAIYLIGSAPDGDYALEFDDAGLGAWDVRFSTPTAPPTVDVDAIAAGQSLGRFDELPVSFSTTNLSTDRPVRVYLDEDAEWGGGHLIADASDLSATTLTGRLDDVPAGDYYVFVEVEPEDTVAVFGSSANTVNVRAYQSLLLTPKKAQLVDSTRRGRDKFKFSAKTAFSDDAPDHEFDHRSDELVLSLGGQSVPFEIRIPAGDAGWKASRKGALTWKSPKGQAPRITVKLDPVKGKLLVKVTRANLYVPPETPLGLELVFGNDRTADWAVWAEGKPGVFTRPKQ